MNKDNPKIDLTEDEVKKVQWIVQLYGTIKELQGEIYAREKSKRYISIFTSGCVTYFIIKILHFVMETQSDAIVFFGAFVTLCLHYIALNNMFENIDSLDDKHVERILDLIEAMKKKEIENEEETILPHS